MASKGGQIRTKFFQTQPWDGNPDGRKIFSRLSAIPEFDRQSIFSCSTIRRANRQHRPAYAWYWPPLVQRRANHSEAEGPICTAVEWSPRCWVHDGNYSKCSWKRQEYRLWWVPTGKYGVLPPWLPSHLTEPSFPVTKWYVSCHSVILPTLRWWKGYHTSLKDRSHQLLTTRRLTFIFEKYKK